MGVFNNVQGQYINVGEELITKSIESMRDGRAGRPEGVSAELLKTKQQCG